VIDPDHFLGGRIRLDRDRSLAALRVIGDKIGRSAVDTADAIIEVVTAKMYAEVVRLIAKKGVDLSDFSLMLYGGAGPTHGFLLARELGIRRVMVPATPGLLCALGCLTTDIKSDFVRTVNLILSTGQSAASMQTLQAAYRDLERQAGMWLGE